jgi:thioredoxin reductase (NADPH)
MGILETDIVVIGAGPAGLFSVFELGMNKLSCHVIDSLDEIGGQCVALYPEKPIYDIPAYPKIGAQELIEQLEDQAAPFKPTYHLGQQVNKITQLDEEGRAWQVVTSKDTVIKCRAIVIAAGVGAFGPNRPPLDGIEAFESKSVFYYVKNPSNFAGKRVVIAGGGDSAVDWALNLHDIAEKLYVVHRRPKFRATPDSSEKLRQLAEAGKIELVIPYQLGSLEGDNGQISAINVKTLSGEVRKLEADILLPFFGLSMNLGPIAEWDLDLNKSHIKIDPLTALTNKPGIYAVGDIATYEHKQKLILTGFAECAQAAHHIRRFLNPDEVIHFEYSTTSGILPAA